MGVEEALKNFEQDQIDLRFFLMKVENFSRSGYAKLQKNMGVMSGRELTVRG